MRPFNQYHIQYLVSPTANAAVRISDQGQSAQGRSAAAPAPAPTPALMINMPASSPFGPAVASRPDEARSFDRPAACRHGVEASGTVIHENHHTETLHPPSQTSCCDARRSPLPVLAAAPCAISSRRYQFWSKQRWKIVWTFPRCEHCRCSHRPARFVLLLVYAPGTEFGLPSEPALLPRNAIWFFGFVYYYSSCTARLTQEQTGGL